ncbi:MAG: EAL domain-containing protein [Thainema sp.]
MIELPGYRIFEQLHAGLKSVVYRGECVSNSQVVAIKILRNERPSFSDLVQFRNQFVIARLLNLPEVVQPHQLLPYGNGYALVMEHFGGVSLKEWIEHRRTSDPEPISLNEILAIALQLTEALNGLFHSRVIHKDLKPSNILIHTATQQVKLTDFSIASRLPRETTVVKTAGRMEGTLAYLSPEQTGRMNRGIDYRTDYYSLGVTLYELLTGHLPFTASTAMEMVYCHMAKQPPPIQQFNPAVPEALAAIVYKLMAKNPEDRYQSALGLKHDLEICRSQLATMGTIVPFTLGQRDISDRFLIPEKLYGREAEVAALLAAFDRVAESGQTLVESSEALVEQPVELSVMNAPSPFAAQSTAQSLDFAPASAQAERSATTRQAGDLATAAHTELILVTGYSGVGKTAVVNEVQKPIVRQRGYFIQGKFDQFNRNIPFSGFLAALRDLMGQLLSESEPQLQRWRREILQAVGHSGQLLIEVIPELEQVIGSQPPVVALAGNAAQNRFNLVFQKFLQVFAAANHPLVIFLDDLQWADLASLELINLLMGDMRCHHLLLIGAYRDHEVSAVHPLMLKLENLQQGGATVNTIKLAPLSITSLNQLVGDTLSCSLELAEPLAALIHQKTQGNPFFATQFLQALYQDQAITFEPNQGYWQCDLVRVREAALTENVVAFMAQQLQKLAPHTQTMLKLAACIGSQFDLATLAIVSEQTETETAIALWPALEMGLVLPESDIYAFYCDQAEAWNRDLPPLSAPDLTYKFLHDRIQQAAYSLIPADQKQQTHLTIGQLLLHKSSPSQRQGHLFAIVNHLNMGRALITDAAERSELAQLNLQAGQKAKAATAYRAAVDYLSQGIDLLAADPWEHQYELTLALHQEITEATYLSTDFQQMEQWAAIVLEQAHTLLETVPIYETKLLADRAQGNYLAAVQTGRQVLQTLGVEFPDLPTGSEIQHAFAETHQLWAGREPLSLLTLPPMTDSQRLAAMQIMTKLTAPTYRALPTLMPLLMTKQVEFSIRYGNCPISIFSYAGYGLSLCSMGEIEAGYGFGQLALGLLAQLQAKTAESRAGYLVHNFVSHWKDPIRTSLSAFVQAYESGLETGDLECVVLNAQAYCHYAYFAGQPLADLVTEMAAYRQTLRQFKQVSLKCLEIVQQAVLNLVGEGDTPWLLTGSVYDAISSVRFHEEHCDRTSLFHYHFNQTVLYYWFGQYEQAAQQAEQVNAYLDGGRAQFPIALFAFYTALIQLARYADLPPEQQPAIWEQIEQQEIQLRNWADFAPSNHQHRWQLIEAEKARIKGHTLEAMDAYDQAIATADRHGFLQDKGLANELAARFYLSCNRPKLAQPYMHEAYYCYAHWGAKAKVEQLERLYPELLQAILAPASLATSEQVRSALADITSSTTDTAHLDLAAVIRASQAISKELLPDQLIVTLMQLVLENAGAEKGSLILRQDEQLVVVAQCINGETCTVQKSLLEASDSLPISLIQRVSRTAEALVIDNMQAELRFAADPYIQQQAPKSVLGLPLIHKNQLMGVLYLENSLTTGAFTCDRIHVLKILCTQAAISFDNANLYKSLQATNDNLQQSLEALQLTQSQLLQATQKLQHDALHDALTNLPNRTCFMQILNHTIQVNHRHPERFYAVLFIDLDRFKNINDSLGHLIGDEFLKLAAQRLQSCVRPADVVARFGGDEFAVLLEDLSGIQDAIAVAQRIQDQFGLAFRTRDYEVFSTASIGITYSLLKYQKATHVLRDADVALYQAKARGRNQCVLFDPAMQRQVTRRLQIEGELRRAIANQEFCLYYQPIMALSTGQTRGFEALVRWQHPTRGLVSPNEFIAIAEETGLICQIGEWVMEAACQQLTRWLAQVSQPLTININLSAIQLKQSNLMERLVKILQTTQVPQEYLKIEITESCILETFTSEAQALKQLKALGIRLCIDDFGTGYSSLSRLHEFPIDTLKIDRSFVQRLNQNSLETVQMVITLAHSLNMDVVAEGIETEAELAILQQLGCELGQGYWYSPPLDTQQASAWLGIRE